MIGGCGRPKTEAVMMLAGQDDAAHSSIDQRANDRVGVELGRIEDGGVLVAVTPFLVSESVDTEMQERRGLQFMPAQLTCGRHRFDKRRGSKSRRNGRQKGASAEKPWRHFGASITSGNFVCLSVDSLSRPAPCM